MESIEFLKNLNSSFFEFVSGHFNEDSNAIMLKYAKMNSDFPLDFAAMQIAARKKCRSKLKTFLTNECFIFPDSLASEQATDERVSRFHASLLSSTRTVADLTAGLGIDAFTLSLNGVKIEAFELDSVRAAALRWNAQALNLDRFSVTEGDSIEILAESGSRHYDAIFIDPARRGAGNKRTYSFADCTPDVLTAMPVLKSTAERILIKASPMLDITEVVRQIPDTSRIFIIVLDGECKEVLIDIKAGENFSGVSVVSICHEDDTHRFDIPAEDIGGKEIVYWPQKTDYDGKYLYEPNAGIMKINASGYLCHRFDGMNKISPNTNLYISDVLYPDFPGRISRITKRLSGKDLKRLRGERLIVVCRNFPVNSDSLRSNYGINEGSHRYLYAFRGHGNDKVILLSEKV